jgi:predicted DNA-binding protein YlxM (UPF0122 family)
MSRTIGQLKKDKRTKAKQKADFLLMFQDYASVSRAARAAKVPRSTVYEWLKNDPEFKANYEEAIKVAIDVLQDEAIRRAHEGTVRPVYQGGKKVGSIREYSDTLLIFLLKGLAPETYKDRFQHEHGGKDGGPVQIETTHKVVFENYSE